MAVRGAVTGEQAIRDNAAERAAAGYDELLLFPCDSAPGRLDRLAEVIRDQA
ncbi:MAG TPA: hypothetical protein VM347_39270 [Nonomuraea sp.]|nr:hypothetical protein [Nonomuraea sp.]